MTCFLSPRGSLAAFAAAKSRVISDRSEWRAAHLAWPFVSQPCVTPIISLLFFRRPAAVLRGIRAIIVLSIYGVTRTRTLAHIGKKILKRFDPASANVNTTSSVVRVFRVIRVIAALAHFDPHTPDRGVGEIVRLVGWWRTVKEGTSAASFVAARDLIRAPYRFFAAIALAQKVISARFAVREAKHKKTVKFLARKINEIGAHTGKYATLFSVKQLASGVANAG